MIKVTYLDHSGFLVELEDAYFLFDYYKGRLPQIDLEKKMFVFVSHVHHDHYRKDIFNLRKHFREIRYVLSSDIEIKAEKDIVQMQPNEKKEVMGAEIRTEGRKAWIRGTSDLQGGYLQAQELRGGAALVVAALAARGESIVEGYSFICRGYEDIVQDISDLGGKIKKDTGMTTYEYIQ